MPQAIPPALERLVKNLMRFPGIGEKSAMRMAIQVLRWPSSVAKELAISISELHEKIGLCSRCYTFSQTDPCSICSDSTRVQDLLCIVEEPGDVIAIEKTGSFKGFYHVLQGVISPRDGIGPDDLKISELLERIPREGIKEVIIATSSTVSGEVTANYLLDYLKDKGIRVSRIACGIPLGTDLKYADPLTLRRALEQRVAI